MSVTYTPGRFVWRELFTRDVAASKGFYGSLFGWTTEEVPMGPSWSYYLWKNGETQIGGMMDIAHLPGGSNVSPHWGVYVSVEDVDQAAQRAVAEGGQILNGPMDIPNVGRSAVIQDPQGASLNLFRSANGDPEDRMARPYEFTWENLSTTDPAKAVAFYEKVVGWSSSPMEGSSGTIILARKSGGGAATVGAAPPGGASSWSTMVSVENVTDALARCQDLGGAVLLGRTPIPDVGAFAIIQDNGGAAICLFGEG